MLEPDCFLRYRISAGMWILRLENPTYTYWPLQRRRRVVLQWFYSVSRRKTFVGGTCAPLSALLVFSLLSYDVNV